jgi:hypothetical protein
MSFVSISKRNQCSEKLSKGTPYLLAADLRKKFFVAERFPLVVVFTQDLVVDDLVQLLYLFIESLYVLFLAHRPKIFKRY